MASKSGKVTIRTEKIVAIANKLGLTVSPKAGWLRVEGSEKGKRLLVHTGKRGTNCVELVGFESEFAVAHPCPPAKTMTQLIDFTTVEDERLILRNIFKTAKLLAAAPKEAPAPEKAPEQEKQEEPATQEVAAG